MPHDDIPARALALARSMTVEERASCLRYDSPGVPRLGIPAYNWWNEALHGVARAGTATVFPQAITLAAMFDAEGMARIGDAIATEARAKYNAQQARGDRDIYKGLTFWSPNVNIFRDPRWGRGQETYGEDPYLTARLGVAFVRGLQGDGAHLKAAACAKHLAAHSGPEATRHGFDARVSEKDLRETYLPAFEALVREAHVEAVMGAYNRVNGVPACGNRALLNDLLRAEWGFAGHVVSDCGAIADIHNGHHVTATAPESAAMALKAGCDLNCGNIYLHLLQALQDGLIEEEEITRAAARVLSTRMRLGILGEGSEYDAISYLENDSDAHAAMAEDAAARGMVLLKNNGVLPLSGVRTLAVIGPVADSRAVLEGNYNGRSSRPVTFLEGLRREPVRILYSEGCALWRDRVCGQSLPDDRLSEAVACAEAADAVVLCLGLDPTIEGEEGDASGEYSTGDKRDLELPESQRRLLSAVLAAGKPTICVITGGGALRVEAGDAILWAGYPGQAGGTALASLLFGRVSPSGRLPVTFYRSADDLPPFEDYAMRGRTYRYFEGEPLYPFGYGLSYASFACVSAAYADGALRVNVRNNGAIDAEEVVQVYVKVNDPDAPPNPRLCAFRRVRVPAGKETEARLEIPEEAFTVIREDGRRAPAKGSVTLYVGGGQPDARTAALTGRESLAIRVR